MHRAELRQRPLAQAMGRVHRRLAARAWVAAYSLEEARESHAVQRRMLRSAMCCVGLAMLGAVMRGAAPEQNR